MRAISFFCGVLALILLVYAGRTHSIDEQSVMATADSLARFGRLDTDLLAFTHWDLPPPSGLGRFGADGEYYSKKAPGMALLAAPLFWLGLRLPWLGSQHSALLLPALLIALAAALVCRLGLRLGYRPAAGLIAGGLMALASPALVYSRMLFTEPLALAGMALALYGAARGHTAGRGRLICGAGLSLALAANAAYALILPVFAVYAVARDGRRAIARWWPAAVPVAAWLAVVALLNQARFGNPFESGYHFDSGEGFTTPLWLGAYGLLVSPARGLLWFFPLGLLAMPGWGMLRRRVSSVAWLALAVLIWHIALFSLWWSWAGGVSWGPRFLLPALPALAACLLPVSEAAVSASPWRPAWAIALSVLALISIGVQLPGALADANRVEAELASLSPWTPDAPPGFNHGWDALTWPALSPIFVGARLLAAGQVEFAWFREGRLDWAALALLASAAAASAWAVASNASGRSATGLLLVWLLLAVNLALARLPRAPLGLAGPLEELTPALAGALPGDVVLSLTPDLTWAMLDVPRRARVVGLPRAALLDDEQARGVLEVALADARRVWLLTYEPPPDDWYGAALAGRGDVIYDEVLDGYRLRVFALK